MTVPTADDLADLLAYRPQPRAWPRPRPPLLPHLRRLLTRLRGVVGCSKSSYPWRLPLSAP
jgi:hypothetical protein